MKKSQLRKIIKEEIKSTVNEAAIDGDRQMITRAIENMTKGRLTVGQVQIEIGRAIDQAYISDMMKQNLKFAMQIKKESVNEETVKGEILKGLIDQVPYYQVEWDDGQKMTIPAKYWKEFQRMVKSKK